MPFIRYFEILFNTDGDFEFINAINYSIRLCLLRTPPPPPMYIRLPARAWCPSDVTPGDRAFPG